MLIDSFAFHKKQKKTKGHVRDVPVKLFCKFYLIVRKKSDRKSQTNFLTNVKKFEQLRVDSAK